MDGYDKDREEFNNNARGRIWENGTDRLYRDRENGYTKPPQSREHWTPEGFRRYDKEKVNEKGQILAVEDKSGSMTGENDRRELEKDRFLLERGIIEHLLVRSVEGESVSKECRELLTGLKRDFPDKFTHLEISRSDAREVWAKGLAIERGRGQQLELPGVRDRAREGKAHALESRREKIAELARARERAEKFRKFQQFRGAAAQGRADARQHADRARQAREQAERATPARETPETAKSAERAKVEREAAERVAQEFPPPSELWRRQEAVEVGERAARETADSASVEREAADKARAAADKERDGRATAEKERADELARLQRQGLPPEVVNILGLGQAEPPSAAVNRDRDDEAPRVERGGSDGPEQSRGISRDR
ncbi:hypothetical protein AB4305_30580 [Nocardia sp. 2YAB30]|uniref:hypothetical protein n=1 Tax=unclassified Nocardia TaxID=2637762 RepID=UPI003F95AE84